MADDQDDFPGLFGEVTTEEEVKNETDDPAGAEVKCFITLYRSRSCVKWNCVNNDCLNDNNPQVPESRLPVPGGADFIALVCLCLRLVALSRLLTNYVYDGVLSAWHYNGQVD